MKAQNIVSKIDVKRATSNLNEYLDAHAVSKEEILEFFSAAAEDTGILVAGSVTEGFANSYSDIDIIMVGKEPIYGDTYFQQTEFVDGVFYTKSGKEVNYDFWPENQFDEIEAALEKIEAAINDPMKLNGIPVLSETQVRVINRLFTGVVLRGNDVIEKLRSRYNYEQFLDYLVIYWLSIHFVYREDAIAQSKEGDRLTGIVTLRYAADCMAAVLLATIGEANVYTKWRIRLLQNNRDELQKENVDQLLDFILMSRESDFEDSIEKSLQFFDGLIMFAVSKRPRLMPALMAYSERVKFSA